MEEKSLRSSFLPAFERYNFPFFTAVNIPDNSLCHSLTIYSMDDTNNKSLSHGLTAGIDEQFHSQDSLAGVNNAESSVPSVSEMLAVISESRELTENLQDLMLSSPCTSQNSYNPITSIENSTEPKANLNEELFELDSTSPSDTCTRTTTAATITNLTYYDKDFQPRNIKLIHQESLKFNVKVENCENVVVGDNAKLDICCSHNKGTLNQAASCRSTGCHLNENCSLVQADGNKNPTVLCKQKKKKSSPSEKNSGKRSSTKTNSEPGKIKTKWRFPLNLSDFTDTTSLSHSIDHWLEKVISSLLSEAQDLDDFDSLIKLLEEARKLRESSVPNCILKLAEAIQAMSGHVEDGEKYNILLTETQFVLAEFYSKEGEYLSALDCLKTLEQKLPGDSQKSRLYAQIAKILEHCLDYSVDFPVDQKEHESGSNTSVSNRNPDEVVLSYYEKALTFSNIESSSEKREIIQRCCYLGKAAVYMRLWERQIETARNLLEVRQNLSALTERLFNSISPAMRCQYYLAEAFLHFFEGGHQMVAEMKIQKAKMIAEEEHFLERRCLGSKRLHFLLAELDKSSDISEVGGEILDLNSIECQL